MSASTGLAVNTLRKGFGMPDPARAPATQAPSAPGEVPEAIPDDASLSDLDRWGSRLEAAAQVAHAEGNLAALVSLTTRQIALAEHRRKAAPPPREDPNDNPDFIEAKARVRKELQRLAHHPLIRLVFLP